ncbi:hypothetical protein CVT25_005561 [Psilocybe cyanescens]|uniref:Laccase n=1 Tax=Psilocybe cyanescens TaxID=93625 RepID=A0A409XRX3_PSICY|nr:hypothetical protein CVT25_005561 [Psilocybe cyanescens]
MFLYFFEYVIQIFFPGALLAAPEIASVATLGPQSTLYVTNEFISPDGFRRSASVINGVYPAPLIIAQKGDNFKLNVANYLSDNTMHRSTSIHWHGVLQRGGTNWADGAVGVSQCPISPNRSFLYQFNATEPGTFWYHSHYGTQYCDGVRGALVVYDPDDPHKTLYDETTVVTLGDWYHIQSPSLDILPAADSHLINGKGRYPRGPLTDLAVVNVEQGKRYRLRIVSISCDAFYTFSIDDHPLTVIEADGESVVPVRGIDALKIFAGQRYSVVLVANQPVGNYWIRSIPPPPDSNAALITFDEDSLNSAILRYKGANVHGQPSTKPTQINILRETQLHALINPMAPGKPIEDGGDKNIHINLAFDEETQLFKLNGATFIPPKVPVLLQILTGTPPGQLLPEGSIYWLPRNKSISISIVPGKKDTPHPFHLHGHSFSVVRSANTPEDPMPGYNYIDPVRRDTVNLGDADSGSNVTIRFTTDNPGPWIFHCFAFLWITESVMKSSHIDWHLERGMAIVFAEDPEDVPTVIRPPGKLAVNILLKEFPVLNSFVTEQWQYLCPIFDNLPASMTSISTVMVLPTS